MAGSRLVTADELLHMPEEGCLLELIRGELVELPYAGFRQAVRAAWIGRYFLEYAEEHGGVALGPCGYLLEVDPDTVLAPDVSYLDPARTPTGDEWDGYPPGGPTVAVEFESPADPPRHLARKIELYMAGGVRRLLVVKPDNRVLAVHEAISRVRILSETDTFDGGDVIPGFRLPVAEFFR